MSLGQYRLLPTQPLPRHLTHSRVKAATFLEFHVSISVNLSDFNLACTKVSLAKFCYIFITIHGIMECFVFRNSMAQSISNAIYVIVIKCFYNTVCFKETYLKHIYFSRIIRI